MKDLLALGKSNLELYKIVDSICSAEDVVSYECSRIK